MLYITKKKCFQWSNPNIPKKCNGHHYNMGYYQLYWRFVYVSHLFCFNCSICICVNHYVTKTFLHFESL